MKVKKYGLIVLLLSSFSSWATDMIEVIELLNRPRVEVNFLENCNQHPLALPDDYFDSGCKKFINDQGQIGEYGKIISQYITSKTGPTSLFLNSKMPGMVSDPGICPNWRNLSKSEKIRFWVWTFASIAQIESSCNPKLVNTGDVPDPKDRPRGLLQLNTLRSNRSWRGPNCNFPSTNEAVTNPRNNLLCGLDIMYELLKGKKGEYESNGKIYPTNSYWEKLRSPKAHKSSIGKMIQMFPGC